MPRRRTLPAPALFALLGLSLGLQEARNLAGFLLSRLAAWRELPEPHGMLWLHRLDPIRGLVAPTELPLRLLTLILLVLALLALGERLNPEFRLRKAEREDGAGPEAPPIFSAANALALSLWLLGALSVPLAGGMAAWGLLFGGIPAWTALLPLPYGPLAQALLIGTSLWWIWGPGPLTVGAGTISSRDKLCWALLAGLALAPAVLCVYAARIGVRMAAEAYSLAVSGPWVALFAAAFLLPIAGCWLLLLCASVLRPRPLSGRKLRAPLSLALVSLLAAGAAGAAYSSFMASIDADGVDIVRRLKLYTSPFHRYALLLFGTQATFSSPPDGTLLNEGPPIVCNGQTMGWVELFLQQRHYNTQLAYPAFVHLHDCGALEWHASLTLQYDLTMAEKAPSSITCSLLMQQLARCDTSPDNRAVLDALADPRRFLWPQPIGNQWLGMAYMRFGEPERGRAYLAKAGLSQAALNQILGGGAPLPDGQVRGRVTIQNKPIELVRLGLVSEQDWRPLVGQCRPFEWRRVLASTYTDREGRFTFKNIPEGRYLLLVTGGGIGRLPGTPGVSTSLPPIMLDRSQPVVNVGEFNIEFIRRPNRPRDGSREI